MQADELQREIDRIKALDRAGCSYSNRPARLSFPRIVSTILISNR